MRIHFMTVHGLVGDIFTIRTSLPRLMYPSLAEKRKTKAKTKAKPSGKTETYESLVKKRDDVLAQIAAIQRQIDADDDPGRKRI